MKNTFAVTMTLLLLGTLAGSVIAYKKATTPDEAAAHASAAASGPEGTATHVETPAAATPAPSDDAAAHGETQPAPTDAGTTANAGTPGVDNTNAAGATGNAPAETANAAHASEPAGDIEAGKTKYAASCAGCHGANAEGGMGGMAPKLNAVKDWTQEQFKTALRDGNTPTKTLAPPMMKFDTTAVTDDEVAGIYAWLKTVD
ncbi:c-type cytochrome [Deinococcus fonticola]|uniref:c-type cytochrome n=1 Tax=Deinococcus fonticola TaxID=2528713 RepID=UPI00107556A3|nr:cytochrome c [Deinococcus fonticola]